MKPEFNYLTVDPSGRVGLLIGKELCPVGGVLAQPVLWIEVGPLLDTAAVARHLGAALALYDRVTEGSQNHEMTVLAAVSGFSHWVCTSKDSNRDWRRRDGERCKFECMTGTLWDTLAAADKARPYNHKAV